MVTELQEMIQLISAKKTQDKERKPTTEKKCRLKYTDLNINIDIEKFVFST